MGKNYKQKTAVFGGSFDPVHLGHIEICKRLSERFARVIVVPSLLSPFKQDAADSAHRLNMLRSALDGIGGVEICTYEIDSGKTPSFMVDTLEYLARRGEKNLVLVIGSDCVSDLHCWHKIEQIRSMADIYVVLREGCCGDIGDTCGLELADFTAGDYSSTRARVDAIFGKEGRTVDSKTAQYIKANGLYQSAITAAFERYNLGAERTEHTYRACLVAIELAFAHSIDVQKAVTAVMLHDIGKYADEKTAGAAFDDYIKSLPKNLKHAPLSAKIAKQDFNICDNDILNAIEFHTTGRPNMSELEKLVYVADAAEPARDDGDMIKRIALENLDKGMAIALKITIDDLKRRGIRDMGDNTLRAFEFYKKYLD